MTLPSASVSPLRRHKPLLRMSEIGWHMFQALRLIVSFKYLTQIFFQISENTMDKFEETT